jgi:hypothetical protein
LATNRVRQKARNLKTISAPLLLPLVSLFLSPSVGLGQLHFVAGAAYTHDLDGQLGIDARLNLDPPVLPVGGFVGADYFLADCAEGCALWGYRAGIILHSATPGFQPYLTGAYLVRERELSDTSEKRGGMALGVGFRMTTGIRIHAEATREFLGGGLDYFVFRVGLGL